MVFRATIYLVRVFGIKFVEGGTLFIVLAIWTYLGYASLVSEWLLAPLILLGGVILMMYWEALMRKVKDHLEQRAQFEQEMRKIAGHLAVMAERTEREKS